MNDALLDIVLQRLAEVPLADAAADLLLAALDGDQALVAQLDATPEAHASDLGRLIADSHALVCRLSLRG